MLVRRESIARWREVRPPLSSAEDCYRVVRLIDLAYEYGGGIGPARSRL